MKNMGRISLAHGSGGVETGEIVNRLIFNKVSESLRRIGGGLGIDIPDDAAAIPSGKGYIVISTDTYTVNPPFFPENNIGGLAASGTINDVLMLGALPKAALDSIVVEEGFPEEDLEVIIDTMIGTLNRYGISLIGGDFKVMPHGSLDNIVINVVGIGYADNLIIDKNLKPGDRIILTGSVGDHGAVILALQQGYKISSDELRSDAKPLYDLMEPLIKNYIDWIHAARDPTRGGVSMALNDWAKLSNTIIVIDEARIHVKEVVRSYSEMLGIDPLHLANEGKALLGVDGRHAEEVLEFIRNLGYEEAEIIGEVKKSPKYSGMVLLKSHIGGYRILEPPRGELVPRIC